MKKQNVNKLAFNKAIVTELNDSMLSTVNGGAISTIIGGDTCTGCCCVSISIKLPGTIILA